MSGRRSRARTEDCGNGRGQGAPRGLSAAARLRGARPSERKAPVATAVLAAIAASDAARCHALGERSRSDDHRDAVNLVKQVTGGVEAASRLQRLLNLKDELQYGFGGMSAQKQAAAIRQARALVEFAEQTGSGSVWIPWTGAK
jgi:hypothetical protein